MSHFDPATTPAVPPRSEVPGAADEGPRALEEETDAEDEAAEGGGGVNQEAMDAAGDLPPEADEEAESPADKSVDEMGDGTAQDGQNDPSHAGSGPTPEEPGLGLLPDNSAGGSAPWAGRQSERGVAPVVIRASGPVVVDAPRSVGAISQWRPAARRNPQSGGTPNPLRGVTTQPGNPLR